MINGAHSIIYSKRPVADRTFLRDVLGFPNVDAGDQPARATTAPAKSQSRKRSTRR